MAGGDISADCERDCRRSVPHATPDHREEPERGNKFGEDLRVARSDVARGKKQRFVEHEMSGRDARECAADLSGNVDRHFAPG